MFLLNSLIFSESNSVGCEEGQKACRVGLGESCWREICFQGKHQSIIATPLEKYSYTIHISSFAIIHILPEGEVWLCGGGPEEVQGVHHQQSSWIEQGGRTCYKSFFDIFGVLRCFHSHGRSGACNAAQMEHPVLYSGG